MIHKLAEWLRDQDDWLLVIVEISIALSLFNRLAEWTWMR